MHKVRLLFLFSAMACAEGTQAVWIDVPYVHQPKEGCGAASIAMIMQYWSARGGGPAISDADVSMIQERLFSPKDHGIPASSMLDYMRGHGFTAFAFSGKWSDLEEQIGKGRPLIVALRPAGQTELHYVVIDGVDPTHDLVTMNDPAERKLLSEERARFEKEWGATYNWLLLAVPAPVSSNLSH